MRRFAPIVNLFICIVALFAIMAAINDNFSFSAKGFLENLSTIHFENNWLEELEELGESLDKFRHMEKPWDFVFTFLNSCWDVLTLVITLIGDFLLNIVVILRFLFNFGFKI